MSVSRILLIKQEDAGATYATDETIQIPDFGIVLPEKSPFLVEVKNLYERGNYHKPSRSRAADFHFSVPDVPTKAVPRRTPLPIVVAG